MQTHELKGEKHHRRVEINLSHGVPSVSASLRVFSATRVVSGSPIHQRHYINGERITEAKLLPGHCCGWAGRTAPGNDATQAAAKKTPGRPCHAARSQPERIGIRVKSGSFDMTAKGSPKEDNTGKIFLVAAVVWEWLFSFCWFTSQPDQNNALEFSPEFPTLPFPCGQGVSSPLARGRKGYFSRNHLAAFTAS